MPRLEPAAAPRQRHTARPAPHLLLHHACQRTVPRRPKVRSPTALRRALAHCCSPLDHNQRSLKSRPVSRHQTGAVSLWTGAVSLEVETEAASLEAGTEAANRGRPSCRPQPPPPQAWLAHSSAKRPPGRSRSSSGAPLSTTRPSPMTTTRSQCMMVSRRWAMVMTLTPCARRGAHA